MFTLHLIIKLLASDFSLLPIISFQTIQRHKSLQNLENGAIPNVVSITITLIFIRNINKIEFQFTSFYTNRQKKNNWIISQPQKRTVETQVTENLDFNKTFQMYLAHSCCRRYYLVVKSCLTLCEATDCNPPVSLVHGTSQARILEWVAISFSRESSRPRDQTHVSCLADGFFTTEPPGKSYLTQ